MHIASSRIVVTLCLIGSVACAGEYITRQITMLTVSFKIPQRLSVETEGIDGTDEIVAMRAGKCATMYCPPIVMAWECRDNAEPLCADLRMLPPAEFCSDTAARSVLHRTGLKETRWVCPTTDDGDGPQQEGFSVFDLKSGKLVVSYLGGRADVSPDAFFDGVALSMKEK